ncbi:hypothetical protein D3C72_757100 [compost metagenome]
MAREGFLVASCVLAVCIATPDQSKACNLPATNEWLQRPPPTDGASFKQVDASLVWEVTNDAQGAVAALTTEAVVEISREQVRHFAGEAAGSAAPNGVAYLVRAVFPSRWPSVRVEWSENDLHVFAGGLGCFRYEKHPVIVYLNRRPANVFVSASAAL